MVSTGIISAIIFLLNIYTIYTPFIFIAVYSLSHFSTFTGSVLTLRS